LEPGENTAEFAIPETSLYYMWLSLPSLLLGAVMTLFLTVVAVFNGIIIGTLTGIARVIHTKALNIIAGVYVDFIRGTPLLVQIFMIHFGSPPLLGALFGNGQPIPLNPFFSGLVALSINSGAYVAEIVRAGIQSIDRGQMEAARSLGMTYRQAMSHVILPQALKRVIPPLANEFICMLKDSSLVSVIGMEELVRKAQIIVTRSYRPTETWLEVGLIFLLMTLPFTRVVAYLERRFKTGD
jgi:glutamine transport system permease protein